MKSFTRLLVLITMLVTCSATSAAFDGPELLIPVDSNLSVELLSPITTSTSKKGDRFSCKVLSPAEYSGAIAEGYVRSVKRSGKANKDSKIDLAFEKITLRDGRTSAFAATVVEVFDIVQASDQGRADNEGTVSRKPRAVRTSIKRGAAGALIGALVGGVLAGGQGAVVGAAIGAGIGVTTTIATRGPDLEFPTGTQFTIRVNGPRKPAQRTRTGT